MKIEVSRFKDGRLKVKVVFESNSNFWKESLTWVPTFEEIERIALSLHSVDGTNKQMQNYFTKRYFKNKS